MLESVRPITERVRPDHWLLAAALLLVAVGTVMVFSASAPLAAENYGRADFFLRLQLTRVIAGLAGLWVVMHIDYRNLRRRPAQLGLLAALILLTLPLWQSLGLSGGVHHGARRWVQMGSLGLQPAEVARLALVVYLADALSRKEATVRHYLRGFLPPFLILGAMAVMVFKQPSLGGAFSLAVVGLTMLYLGGVRLRHLVLTCTTLIPLLVWQACRAGYRWQRIEAFLHPERDLSGAGYQMWHSKIALASGGLTGLGLGHSRERFLFLPDAHTDFILSIVGEELGFIGLAAVMCLFMIFVWRGMKIAAEAPDRFGFLLAAGLTLSVAVYWAINVGVVCHFLPVTGLPLPFLSYGGSSLFVHLVGVGLLLSVSRYRRLRRGERGFSGTEYAGI